MKKIIFILALALSSYCVHAQTNGYFNVLKVTPLENAPAYFYMDTNIPASDGYAPQIQIIGYTYAAGNKAMKVTLGWYYYAGNFYWTQYQSDLGYQKPSRIRLGKYTKSGTDYIRIEVSNNSTYWANYNILATDIGSYMATAYSGWTYTEGEMPTATTSQITVVNQQADVVVDGKVGIGSPPLNDYKLAVNGAAIATSMKVKLQANWPDFVFLKNYKLPTLAEVKTYIDKNKHLPDMPSASEVNANGLDLGEMNRLLLKKVEELTLYLIEKDDNEKQLKKEFVQMKKQQEERINALEKALENLTAAK